MLVVVSFWFFSGIFASEKGVIEELRKQGHTEIKIVECQWFLVSFSDCGYSDTARFLATATMSPGENINLAICTGPFSGYSVRAR